MPASSTSSGAVSLQPLPVRGRQRHDCGQGDREGQQERRGRRLLEGGLGEVGGHQVRAGDKHGGEEPAARCEPVERGPGGHRGQDRNRHDQADEGGAEADPRQVAERRGEAVRAERVARARLGAEADRSDSAQARCRPRSLL